MVQFIKKFLEMEAAGGLVLLAAAALALVWANSPTASYYEMVFAPPVVHGINDGLMAVFFLMVGLEIKREFIGGELSTRAKAIFPLVTALGGVAFPALIYLYFNGGTPEARGWAIGSATDIAFSLGILSLFGSRVPMALKVFLMALAVIDDLIAVLVIAIFYTASLSMPALITAAACALVIWSLNRQGIARAWPYIIMGVLLWLAVLYSGVHATVAGVALGMLMPMQPLGEKVIERIHPFVAYGIMPLFALANAGIPLAGMSMESVLNPLSLGIMAALFFGKQFGIAFSAWCLIALRLSRLPAGASPLQFYAVSVLAGIGFTMSLFIGNLAFGSASTQLLTMKLAVILGSALSAAFGCVLMAIATRRSRARP